MPSNGDLSPTTLRTLPGFAPYPGRDNFLPVSTTTLSDLVTPAVLVDAKNMAAAFARDLNEELTYAEAYRSFTMQQQRKREQAAGGPNAASPGTSNHGLAKAIDYRNGIGYADTATYQWMRDNAGKYGFVEDVPGEHWHWHHPSDTALTTPTTEGASTGTTPLEEDMPLTKAEKQEIATLVADEVLSRMFKSNAWKTVANQVANAATHTAQLLDPFKGAGYLVWSYRLATSKVRRSASDVIRSINDNTK